MYFLLNMGDLPASYVSLLEGTFDGCFFSRFVFFFLSWRCRWSHWGFWEIDNLMYFFVSFFPIYASFFWLLGNSRVPNIMRKKTRGYLSTNAIDIDSAKIRLNVLSCNRDYQDGLVGDLVLNLHFQLEVTFNSFLLEVFVVSTP